MPKSIYMPKKNHLYSIYLTKTGNISPFLQIYAPNNSPNIASQIKINKFNIGFLNINGGAFKKIRHTHPMFFQLMTKKSLDFIALIATRQIKKPNWFLPGYDWVDRPSYQCFENFEIFFSTSSSTTFF